MDKRSFAPPTPNWQCNDCSHELYLKGMDESPKICPKCGSTNVFSTHMQEFIDPPPLPSELGLDLDVHR